MPLREDDTRAAARPKRSLKGILAAGAAGLMALLIIIYLVTERQGTPAAQPPTTPETSPTVIEASGTNDPAPTTPPGESDWSKTQNDVYIGDAAPGLHQCLAVVDGNQTSAIDGVRTGFPRTLQGGLSAILNYTKYLESTAALLPDVAARVNARIFYEPNINNGLPSEDRQKRVRESLKINEQGDPLLADGTVDPHHSFYADAYPEYGAYHVDRVYYTKDGDPNFITATVWMPQIWGPGTDDDMSQVKILWGTTQMIVAWDYDLNEWVGMFIARSGNGPQPAQPTFTNQTFATRAKLLGPGWCVPGDASERAIPGTALTK